MGLGSRPGEGHQLHGFGLRTHRITKRWRFGLPQSKTKVSAAGSTKDSMAVFPLGTSLLIHGSWFL